MGERKEGGKKDKEEQVKEGIGERKREKGKAKIMGEIERTGRGKDNGRKREWEIK